MESQDLVSFAGFSKPFLFPNLDKLEPKKNLGFRFVFFGVNSFRPVMKNILSEKYENLGYKFLMTLRKIVNSLMIFYYYNVGKMMCQVNLTSCNLLSLFIDYVNLSSRKMISKTFFQCWPKHPVQGRFSKLTYSQYDDNGKKIEQFTKSTFKVPFFISHIRVLRTNMTRVKLIDLTN